MVTYPSTHGVFEDTITELCALVHDAGGQVYVDGANLNALVGLAQPGKFGADVSHLNLHKTFCIPHGGGGPGVGPVGGARAPGAVPAEPPARPEAGPGDRGRPDLGGAVRVGRHPADLVGLRAADGRRRPAPGHRGGRPQRELRRGPAARALPGALLRATTGSSPTSASSTCAASPGDTGVTVDDVAKRLIDYGFHAPTMSFPVAGTLMVEPTESEDKGEIDRFCDAMIAIRGEIDAVGRGDVAVADSVLRARAAHRRRSLAGEWDHPYDRDAAAFPGGRRPRRRSTGRRCGRIDGAYGDRHLVCSLPAAGGVRGLSARMPAGRLRRPARPPRGPPAPRRCCRWHPCAPRPGG